MIKENKADEISYDHLKYVSRHFTNSSRQPFEKLKQHVIIHLHENHGHYKLKESLHNVINKLDYLTLDEDFVEKIIDCSKLKQENQNFNISFPLNWQDIICYIYQGNVNVYDHHPTPTANRTLMQKTTQNDENGNVVPIMLTQYKGGSIFKVNKELRQNRKFECAV